MRWGHTRFKDRRDAGRMLAEQLASKQLDDPVVLALPRGGVPVAAEVAHRLKAPLDVVLVRKLGAPGQKELAIGAMVDGAAPQIVLNESIIAELDVSQAYIDAEAARELATIERRRHQWLEGRTFPPLAGRTVIVVDDGIATGATVRAAIEALRKAGPRRLIVAVPVASRQAVALLRDLVDAVVALQVPEPLVAIGYFYDDFSQVEDDEVAAILKAHPPGA